MDGYPPIDSVSRNDTRNLELNIIDPFLPRACIYLRTRIFFPLENSPFSLPFRPHPHVPLAREQGEEVGEREDGKKEREREREEEKKEHGRALGIDA